MIETDESIVLDLKSIVGEELERTTRALERLRVVEKRKMCSSQDCRDETVEGNS